MSLLFMSVTLLTAFNNNLNLFVNELIQSYPQEHNFSIFKNMISLMQKVNPRKVLILFIEYISPYKQKILERDESFFLEENYDTIMKTVDDRENAWLLMNKLKLYWKDTNNANKDIIWKYFKQLITLSAMATKQK